MRPASASAPLRTARRKGPCSSRSHRRRRERASGMVLATTSRSALGALRQRAEVGGQPGLEPGLDLARQHRRGALGADRHRDGSAVDDGRHDEGGELGRVDDVDGNAARLGRARDGGVEQRGRRWRHRRGAGPRGRGRGRCAARSRWRCSSSSSRSSSVTVSATTVICALVFEQQPHLLRRLLAAADHQHVRLVEVGKEGKVLHAPQAPARVTSRPSRCLSQIS